ncbi:MAG TPA: ABC transporter ATP-binding protein, partial [Desulfotomaculum sp.]|nr:ABC transporter ATP-binding protein [Desulfotomaculum sp.]
MFKDLRTLWKLIRIYLKGKTPAIAFGFFTALVFSLLGLATPYITKFLIDVIFHGQREDLLLPLLFFCGAVLVVMSFTGIISDYVLVNCFEQAKLSMRQDLFTRLQKAPFDFLSVQRSGELNYRVFGDTEAIETFFSRLLINIPLDLLFGVIIGAIMVGWHFNMAVFVFLVLSLQVLVIIGFRKPLLRYAFLRKGQSQALSGFVVERFRNIQLIRTLNTEETEADNFRRGLGELMRLNVRSFMLGRLSELSVTLVNNIWSFGILWYGGMLVLAGEITLGTLMAFLLISGMLYPRIASISGAVLAFQDVRASLHRFLEYYQTQPVVLERPGAAELRVMEGRVVCENLAFGYTSAHLVLRCVTAEFAPHTITAVVGRSGSGKSTLARLLVRLYDPAAGRILIDDTDIREVTLGSLRRKVGYLVQGEFLFSGTIWDNICYGVNPPGREAVAAAAKKAAAYDFIMQLPDGFSTRIGEGGIQLSGGEAQRIALARAFLA